MCNAKTDHLHEPHAEKVVHLDYGQLGTSSDKVRVAKRENEKV